MNLSDSERKRLQVENREFALGLLFFSFLFFPVLVHATYLLCDAQPEACVCVCAFQPHSNSVAPSALKPPAFRRRDACVHADSETTGPTSRKKKKPERRRMIAEQVGGFLSCSVETRLISSQSCQTTSSGDISDHMKESLARVAAVNLGGGNGFIQLGEAGCDVRREPESAFYF